MVRVSRKAKDFPEPRSEACDPAATAPRTPRTIRTGQELQTPRPVLHIAANAESVV
jgi:hypothetical protein